MDERLREKIEFFKEKITQQFYKLSWSYSLWLDEKVKEGDGFSKVDLNKTFDLIGILDYLATDRKESEDKDG